MADGHDSFDFWYAVNNTEVVMSPTQLLETFGTTDFTYFLIAELMDRAGRFRVREGRIGAARPQILTPDHIGGLPLEGFDQTEARRYIEWLRENAGDMRLLQYGFTVHKKEVRDHVVSDPPEQIVHNIKADIARREQDNAAIVLGVEDPWEVCLIKLMVGVVERSAPGNVQDLRQASMLPGPEDMREQIDQAFLEASRDHDLIPALHGRLVAAGVFDEYEDRFFALVRAARRDS